MPFEIMMPRLGWNMESGSLGQWLKADGEQVEVGELLFTVEGDKATQEVEALESGTLYIPPDAPPPGKEVPVGTVLGYLLARGEERPGGRTTEDGRPTKNLPEDSLWPVSDRARGARSETDPSRAAVPASGFQPSGPAPTISPRARRVAEELGLDWAGAAAQGTLTGGGRTGRIRERDVRAAAQQLAEEAALATPQPVAAQAATVSPLARRLAAELGVDVDALASQLPGRRIERADVERAAQRLLAAALAQPPAPAPAVPPATGNVQPVTGLRRTIAERMAASAHTTAPVTLTTEADATELVRLRTQLKADGRQPIPSYTDLLVRLCAVALTEHPMLNAHFEGESIVRSATADIGLAVDTERGLLVPVLRDAGAKSVREIAAESASLIQRTREGRATMAELRGGSFTITNLGMYEIDAFTPIINLPECAILGVGRIVPKQILPVALDEIPALADQPGAGAARVVVRAMMFLSLTFDHRLVDGAPAARFLQRVKQFVEKPYLWLAG